MIVRDFTRPSTDGIHTLHGKEWLPDENVPVRAVIQLAHGIAEYIARYDCLGQYLAGKGIALIGLDHIGHGGSVSEGEQLGFTADEGGWLTFVKDAEALRAHTAERFESVPYFMMGHSMGSFVMRVWSAMYPTDIAGLILCGTGTIPGIVAKVGLAVCGMQAKKVGLKGSSASLKKLMFGPYNKRIENPKSPNAWINSDDAAVAAYDADPLCGFDPSIALCADLLNLVVCMGKKRNAAKMPKDVPVYLMAGVEDPVGDYGKGVNAAADMFRAVGVKDVQVRLWPKMRHEVLNEPGKEAGMDELFAWVESKI